MPDDLPGSNMKVCKGRNKANMGSNKLLHCPAVGWLEGINPFLQGVVNARSMKILRQLEREISSFVGTPRESKSHTGEDLLAFKKELAAKGFGALDLAITHGGGGFAPVIQCIAQFILGYYNTDLRDVVGPGHARLILSHGSPTQLERWRQPILSGLLGGIAVTESQGGSSLLNLQTTLRQTGPDQWLLSGEKSWISRIKEASVFVVFARIQPEGGLAAIIIEPVRPGVSVEPIEPAGLKGWSWGKMRFDKVMIGLNDLLAVGKNALSAFHDHFAYYRPLAAATVLGTAASVCDFVARRLVEKGATDFRDVAHKTLGLHYGAIQAALLFVANACASKSASQRLLGCAAKAYGADVALSAIDDLALLLGAESFQENSLLHKAQRDVRAYQFADGANDALYRYTGRKLIELVAGSTLGNNSEVTLAVNAES